MKLLLLMLALVLLNVASSSYFDKSENRERDLLQEILAISRRKLGKNKKLDILTDDSDLEDVIESNFRPNILANGRIDLSEPEALLESFLSAPDMGVVALPKKVKGKKMKNPLDMMPKHMTPVKFLEQYGYLKKTKDEKHNLKAAVKAIKHFQKMYHMAPSGVIDTETMTAMLKPRCGMPDATPPPEDFTSEEEAIRVHRELTERAKRYTAKGYKWSKTDLTYFFRNLSATSQLDRNTQRSALSRGLQMWSQHSSLRFREAYSGEKADINIMFTQGQHGDGAANAFDGPSGVLAHAYYPESGEAHFDDSEEWTDGESRGINLMIVAAHEFGHAMGLGHSTVEKALMAPYYQGFESNFQLRTDDIQGIQALYGPPGNTATMPPPTPPTTTTTTVRPPVAPPPSTCSVPFKAVTQTHDHRINVFYGDYIWRISEYGLDPDFPMMISDLYENPPSNIDAAYFSWNTYYTYFFKGNQVWRYYGFMFMDQKAMTSYYSPRQVRAAVETPSGSICLLEGNFCYTFDELKMDTTGYPTSFTSVFPGVPTTFDSVMTLTGEPFLYFFFGNYYDKYSTYYKSLLSGYPKLKAGPWMGPVCGGSSYGPR